MANFPSATPSFAGFTSSHTLSADNHAAQHNLEQGEIVALANKMGTGASTPTSGMLLRGNGVGTSVWGQAALTTDVTGVLPVANGGTGQVSLTSLPLVSPVITAGGSWAGSPTITTPTLTTPVIASFASANHNHQNSAGGETLGAAAVPALDYSVQSRSNPYKFHAWLNQACNSGNNAFALVTLNAELFDTNNNFNTATSTYTVPITGFYWVFATVRMDTANGSGTSSAIFKNGGTILNGVSSVPVGFTGSFATGVVIGGLLSLTAGDTLDLRSYSGGQALHNTQEETFFGGFLVSTT